jgi:outer membrane protein OmpA-like peptidoglycan-associated protein
MLKSLWVLAVLAGSACTKTVVLKEPSPLRVSSRPSEPARPPEPEPQQRVEVKEDRIEVNETIYFDFNKATIRDESFGLLDEIANVMNEHVELTKIRIEGHTDSVGGAAYNKDLSKRRAKAVLAYLVKKGVDTKRLSSQGFGLDNPVADNSTDEGRSKNRRVVFAIVERRGTETAGDAR